MPRLYANARRFWRPLSMALCLLGTAADGTGAAMRDLQVYDQLLGTIGYRLAVSAGDLCPAVPLLGLAVQDVSQYDSRDRATAERTFDFRGSPLVLAVAADSPAARAGVRPDDAIRAIDGAAIPPDPVAGADSYRRVAHVLDLLDTAAREGPVTLTLRRGDTVFDTRLIPVGGCAARFQTRLSSVIDAVSDGSDVLVDVGLMRFAGSEDQIAAIVGHELSHVILHHHARLASVTTGKVAAIRRTEDEADRLSVYLLDRARYPTLAIVNFWQRYRRAHALFLRSATHASAAERIAMVEGEEARIARMKAQGLSPHPDFAPAPVR